MKTRILIADDHTILRSGLGRLINAESDMEIVGEASTCREAEEKIRKLGPDITIMDIAMGRRSGIQTIARIQKIRPRSKFLVLTMHTEVAYMKAALAAGASGYVVKHVADNELLTAIRAVTRGGMFVDSSFGERVVEEMVMQAPANRGKNDVRGSIRLSPRENEVMGLIAQGYTNREVADRLGLSVKSVETYRGRLLEKLGLQTRSDLIRFALETGALKTG